MAKLTTNQVTNSKHRLPSCTSGTPPWGALAAGSAAGVGWKITRSQLRSSEWMFASVALTVGMLLRLMALLCAVMGACRLVESWVPMGSWVVALGKNRSWVNEGH